MAWNPSPEVAVARDAAKRLGDAQACVIVYVSADGKQVGMASYGKTKAICQAAGRLGDHLFSETMKRGLN